MTKAEVTTRYGVAVRACQEGRPRGYIEGYLKINPAASLGARVPMVPFRLLPTQELMYGETFGRLRGYGDGMKAVVVKSRDVYATSLFAAVAWAVACCVPGVRVMYMIDNEDKFKTVIAPMLKGFYENMDEEVMGVRRPGIAHWDTEVIEIRHGGETMQANSFVKFASSKSVNAPRAYKPKLFIFSEAAFAEQGSEALLYESVDNALGAGGWAIWESTANGPSGNFHERYRAYKEGAMLGRPVFVPFYADPMKRIPRGSEEYLLHMRVPMTVDEEKMVARFPAGAPADEIIAWWRMKFQEALTRLGGDRNGAMASMLREYPLDDVSVWTHAGNPRFDPAVLAYLGAQARAPLETEPVAGGGVVKIWERPMAGHAYVAGMDFATERGPDATSLQVLDATTLTYVAELHGKNIGVFQALDAAVGLCRTYHDALFVPEMNTVGATGADHPLYRHGYEQIFYESAGIKPGEAPRYGWTATHATVLDLWALFQGYVNQGALKMPNGALSGDLARYDGGPQQGGHWPDRMRAAALALHGAAERGMLGKAEPMRKVGPSGDGRLYIAPMRGTYFHAA